MHMMDVTQFWNSDCHKAYHIQFFGAQISADSAVLIMYLALFFPFLPHFDQDARAAAKQLPLRSTYHPVVRRERCGARVSIFPTKIPVMNNGEPTSGAMNRVFQPSTSLAA